MNPIRIRKRVELISSEFLFPSHEKNFIKKFRTLVDAAHGIDRTRPVTTVYGPTNFDNDETADLMDFICVNRYYGWYIDMGQDILDIRTHRTKDTFRYIPWINQSVYWDISLWRETFHKPIIVTEYGADSIPGLNQEPSVDFSEQYQNEVIQETHHAFDALHKDHTITGEMIWNFADFMTGMSEFLETELDGSSLILFSDNPCSWKPQRSFHPIPSGQNISVYIEKSIFETIRSIKPGNLGLKILLC